MAFTYDYPHPAVTVDCVVFGFDGQGLSILLIERGNDPFKGQLALPGGFVGIDEDLMDAAHRELKEETGITVDYLEQLYTFGAPARDPRERIISVAWLALVRQESRHPKGGDDASSAQWVPLKDDRVQRLAFDHSDIVAAALTRLRNKIRYAPIGFTLLPEPFTLNALQQLYETLLDRPIDRRNFRRKILKLGILDPMGKQAVYRTAPAIEYRFNVNAYLTVLQQGKGFEL